MKRKRWTMMRKRKKMRKKRKMPPDSASQQNSILKACGLGDEKMRRKCLTMHLLWWMSLLTKQLLMAVAVSLPFGRKPHAFLQLKVAFESLKRGFRHHRAPQSSRRA
jgi:hypothetical protein